VWDQFELERNTPPASGQLDLEDLMTTTAVPAASLTPAPVEAPASGARIEGWIETEGDWIT